MKTLLVAINSKYIHSNLAVFSLKAYASKFEQKVQIAEYTINNYMEDILKDIYLRKPDFIGFSCYIWNMNLVSELCEELAKVLPNTHIWLGGPEVSYDCIERLQAMPFVKGIMIGEGEQTFLSMLEAYHNQESFNKVAGIAYRKEDEIVVNQPVCPINLDEIPFPYEDLSKWENKIIYYESSRGCPFSCAYCLSSVDKRVRFRSTHLVLKELEKFQKAGVAQVKFVDRTFNCNKKHALTIWQYLVEHDNGITNFHFEISADLLDEDSLDIFKKMRPGLIQLEIGVQSTNPATIEAIGRKMDLEKLSKMTGAVHEMGNIHQHLDLIAGLPYEDYDTFSRSFDWVYQQKPDQLQLGFLKLLKGTTMRTKAPSYGIVCQNKSPYEVLFTDWLTYDEILKLKGIEEVTELYYNSNQFHWTLLWAVKKETSPFAFFEELSQYYCDCGYDEMGSSRLARYELMYQFLTKVKGYDETEVGNLLTYDYCLREKIKKKPFFLPNDNLYRKEKADFFAKKSQELEGTSYRQLVNSSEAIVFDFEPENFAKNERKGQKKVLVIFDYSHRNPLNHNATTFEGGLL
jgi:radical SAM superfamily enzyme YgiQ (UPF0313 family)